MYGYEGFPDEAAGLDYVYSGTDSIELHWTDEHGEKRETKLSWPQAAGIVQRLVDEGRYLEAPAVSEPEQKDGTQPFSAEYRLLDRLCADCEYFWVKGSGRKSTCGRAVWRRRSPKCGSCTPNCRKTGLALPGNHRRLRPPHGSPGAARGNPDTG